jgi:hypothetical protein
MVTGMRSSMRWRCALVRRTAMGRSACGIRTAACIPYACQESVERERPSHKTRLNVIAKNLHFAGDGKGDPGLVGTTATGQGEFALEGRL